MEKVFIGTSKEKFYYHNTLLCLVRGLQGKNITVDLRDDAYICGCVTTVDGYMNISFSNAVYCDPRGNEFSFENLFLQGRKIRYVHIPETSHVDHPGHVVFRMAGMALGPPPTGFIQSVHVPPTRIQCISMLAIIKNELTGQKRHVPDKKSIEKSRKAKKALRQHMETVASLNL